MLNQCCRRRAGRVQVGQRSRHFGTTSRQSSQRPLARAARSSPDGIHQPLSARTLFRGATTTIPPPAARCPRALRSGRSPIRSRSPLHRRASPPLRASRGREERRQGGASARARYCRFFLRQVESDRGNRAPSGGYGAPPRVAEHSIPLHSAAARSRGSVAAAGAGDEAGRGTANLASAPPRLRTIYAPDSALGAGTNAPERRLRAMCPRLGYW